MSRPRPDPPDPPDPRDTTAAVDPVVARLNAHAPAVIRTLGGRVTSYAPERLELGMDFDIGLQCCHSVDIVQGGFVTAMLDAAMAHVLIASQGGRVRISSIDIHVNFLRPARAGGFSALASVVKAGQSVASSSGPNCMRAAARWWPPRARRRSCGASTTPWPSAAEAVPARRHGPRRRLSVTSSGRC